MHLKTNIGAPMKKSILIILISLLLGGTAHAAFAGFKLENDTGYVFMEDGGFVLLEEATASSPTSGINPALLFIILDD
jgi:hypothetical protein